MRLICQSLVPSYNNCNPGEALPSAVPRRRIVHWRDEGEPTSKAHPLCHVLSHYHRPHKSRIASLSISHFDRPHIGIVPEVTSRKVLDNDHRILQISPKMASTHLNAYNIPLDMRILLIFALCRSVSLKIPREDLPW